MITSLFWAFFKIGAFGFGGGYVMIPLIQREIVEVRKWLTLSEFIDLIAIAEMTPGPIAVNSATFVGFKQAGVLGAISATVGVILPPVIVMAVLSYLFMRLSCVPAVQRALSGIRPAVVGLIAAAAITLGRSVITDLRGVVIAVLVFLGLEKTRAHPITLLGLAGVAGLFLYLK